MKNSNINQCQLIELNKVHNRAGNLTIVENHISIPFSVKRIYYLYDVPSNAERGGHAHKELHQLIVAASGSFRITLNDGKQVKSFFLNNPNIGLLIVPGIWRDLSEFSSGSVCLVLASMKYEAEDYIRDFQEFQKYKK
ncbi:sugar 3,4-ketoisomerase [Cecembia rubra]|uniref:WxcM-like protein n=1 Tax=Cecembia rubra TaxID=1485585 RepID=A0A2P8EA23_9BACT|nr:FdtA/QdtA family cupin domain-containing protein [Cecembia rubra]PSL06315.1 WxcM-like protein [Cecembia rubra]